MASESQESSFMERLINSRNRDLSFFLPLILGITNPENRSTPDRESRDRIILINPATQGMVVIESSRSLESLFREMENFNFKQGLPPASKASIEAMPKIVITEEDEKDGECSICLDDWEIGGEAREMPCKHRYHSGCIEKWLGIHGSCPVCRFKMPVDEEEGKKRGDGGGEEEEEERGEVRRELWVSFAFGGRRNSSSGSESADDESNPRAEAAADGDASQTSQESG